MPTPDESPTKAPPFAATRALVRGATASLLIVAASACAQRIALPLAALWLGDRGPSGAVAPLLAAAALSFVRARASDHLSRVVRLRIVELFTRKLARGVVVPAPPPEVSAARFATAMPVLVGFAVEGVAIVIAGAIAAPVVALLVASSLGKASLVPLLAAGLAGALVTALASPRLESTWGRTFEHARVVLASASAAFSGAAEIIVHRRGRAVVEGLRSEVVAWSSAELRARTTSAIASWGALSATIAAAALALGLLDPTSLRAATERDQSRALLLVLAAIPTVQMLLAGIGSVLHARSELAALRDRGEIQDDRDRSEHERAPQKTLDPRGEVRVERVAYRYPPRDGELAKGDTPALRDLSFVLPAGDSLAIVGPNGSGKTTLLWLLLGLVRPDEGRILVGGAALSEGGATLGARVAFVSQAPYEPPDATIADALRTFDESASDATLLGALDAMGLLAALRARASSDAAVLSIRLSSLSRGQTRRVMLARALVREVDLIVLDEPEAHLDAASVAELEALLQKLAQTCRVIAAVHDPAVVGFAHQVLRLS